MTLRRIGVLSVGKIAGLLYGGIGLFFGAIFSLLALAGVMSQAASGSGGGEEAFFGLIFGVGAVIFVPLFYGVLGAVFAAIGAALYNLAAGLVGGIEIEIDGLPQAPAASTYAPPAGQGG